jgi:hypothetical protein
MPEPAATLKVSALGLDTGPFTLPLLTVRFTVSEAVLEAPVPVKVMMPLYVPIVRVVAPAQDVPALTTRVDPLVVAQSQFPPTFTLIPVMVSELGELTGVVDNVTGTCADVPLAPFATVNWSGFVNCKRTVWATDRESVRSTIAATANSKVRQFCRWLIACIQE